MLLSITMYLICNGAEREVSMIASRHQGLPQCNNQISKHLRRTQVDTNSNICEKGVFKITLTISPFFPHLHSLHSPFVKGPNRPAVSRGMQSLRDTSTPIRKEPRSSRPPRLALLREELGTTIVRGFLLQDSVLYSCRGSAVKRCLGFMIGGIMLWILPLAPSPLPLSSAPHPRQHLPSRSTNAPRHIKLSTSSFLILVRCSSGSAIRKAAHTFSSTCSAKMS